MRGVNYIIINIFYVYIMLLKTLCRLQCNARVVYVLIPLEREHCDKMARFEPFSSQERK